MSELDRLLAAAAAFDAAGTPYALATLVKVEGSAYRRPGARVLVGPDGAHVGAVSAGCLEAEVVARARLVLGGSPAETVALVAREGEDAVGFGLGCGGTVHVLLERAEPGQTGGHALALLREATRTGHAHALATVFRASGALATEAGRHVLVDEGGEAPQGSVADGVLHDALAGAARDVLALGRSAVRTFAGGAVEALVEIVRPPVRLVVFGQGPDAGPVVRLGAALGWTVVVVGSRPAAELGRRFPEAAETVCLPDADDLDRSVHVPLTARTAVVVMSHNYLRDRATVRYVLGSAVPYVGVLGSRRRLADLLGDLGSGSDRAGQLYGPAGLDIGSETPEEIALAVVAEAQAVLAGRAGGPLRERRGPTHDALGTGDGASVPTRPAVA